MGPFDLNQAPLTDLNPEVPATGLFLGDNQGLVLSGKSAATVSALAFFAATDGFGAHVYAARPPDPFADAQAHVYSSRAAAAQSMRMIKRLPTTFAHR